MEVSQFADPIKIGPGVWFSLHLSALYATTDEAKRVFINYVATLCANFRCLECQKHFYKYLEDHPLLPYWDRKDGQGRSIGMFIWTWEFHNAVNRYLRKYEPTLEEAYEYYANNLVGVCTDCGKKPELPKIPSLIEAYRAKQIQPQPFRARK